MVKGQNMHMEIIIKQFRCTSKTEYTETTSIFSAIIDTNHNNIYILEVKSERYENSIIKSNNITNIYFNTHKELEENYSYHYNLCKNNLFTTKIEITI